MLEDITLKRYLTVSDGTKLRIQTFENAPSRSERINVIVIGGMGSYMFAWQIFLSKIIHDYNVIFLETREKETAILGTENITFARIRKDILEIIEQLNIDIQKAIFITTSAGSIATLKLLVDQHIHPKLSILVSPLPYNYIGKIAFYYGRLPLFWHKTVTKTISRIGTFFISGRDKLQRKYILQGINRTDFRKYRIGTRDVVDFNILNENYETIKDKIIIIGARKDRIHPIKYVKMLVEKLPQAEYFEVEYNSDSLGLGLFDIFKKKTKGFVSS